MILVIGYGNPLRSDDAVGQHVAQAVGECLQQADLLVQTVYQLTPELVEVIRCADSVIFIDARIGDVPGVIVQETVYPLGGTGAFTHNVTPASLIVAADELYGVRPAGLLISIVGESFDYGTELSPSIQNRLPIFAHQIADIIQTHTSIHKVQENSHA